MTIVVRSLEPNLPQRTFDVFVDGYWEEWTLDLIKENVNRGASLTLWKEK